MKAEVPNARGSTPRVSSTRSSLVSADDSVCHWMGLPREWTVVLSLSKNREYYFNTATGECTWDHPGLPTASSEADDQDDWGQVMSVSRNRPYWFNARTGACKWDPPAGFSRSPEREVTANGEREEPSNAAPPDQWSYPLTDSTSEVQHGAYKSNALIIAHTSSLSAPRPDLSFGDSYPTGRALSSGCGTVMSDPISSVSTAASAKDDQQISEKLGERESDEPNRKVEARLHRERLKAGRRPMTPRGTPQVARQSDVQSMLPTPPPTSRPATPRGDPWPERTSNFQNMKSVSAQKNQRPMTPRGCPLIAMAPESQDLPSSIPLNSMDLKLKLKMDSVMAGTPNSIARAKFEQGLIGDLSAAVDLPPDCFKITGLCLGSIIVDVRISPDPRGNGPSPQEAMRSIAKQADESTSKLRKGRFTCYIESTGILSESDCSPGQNVFNLTKDITLIRDQKGDIGLRFFQESIPGPFIVFSVVPDGPAALCGSIWQGQHILAVDGIRVHHENTEQVSTRMRGAPGSRITLTISMSSFSGSISDVKSEQDFKSVREGTQKENVASAISAKRDVQSIPLVEKLATEMQEVYHLPPKKPARHLYSMRLPDDAAPVPILAHEPLISETNEQQEIPKSPRLPALMVPDTEWKHVSASDYFLELLGSEKEVASRKRQDRAIIFNAENSDTGADTKLLLICDTTTPAGRTYSAGEIFDFIKQGTNGWTLIRDTNSCMCWLPSDELQVVEWDARNKLQGTLSSKIDGKNVFEPAAKVTSPDISLARVRGSDAFAASMSYVSVAEQTSSEPIYEKRLENLHMQTSIKLHPIAPENGRSSGIKLTLDLDYSLVATANSATLITFKKDLIIDLATASSEPPEIFEIQSFAPGSIVASIRVSGTASMLSGFNSTRVASFLEKQALDPSSILRSGKLTCKTIGIEQVPGISDHTSNFSLAPSPSPQILRPPSSIMLQTKGVSSLPSADISKRPPHAVLHPALDVSETESPAKLQNVTLHRGVEGRLGLKLFSSNSGSGPYMIVSLEEGGTAAKSGMLRPGDVLHAIDRKPVEKLSFNDVVNLLAGSSGSQLVLSISRSQQSAEFRNMSNAREKKSYNSYQNSAFNNPLNIKDEESSDISQIKVDIEHISVTRGLQGAVGIQIYFDDESIHSRKGQEGQQGNGSWRIHDLVPQGAASQCGLFKPGMFVHAIDMHPIQNLHMEGVLSMLKGKPGSKVIVSVYTLKPDVSSGRPPSQFSIDEQERIVSRFKRYMQCNNNQGLIEMQDDILDFSACIMNQRPDLSMAMLKRLAVAFKVCNQLEEAVRIQEMLAHRAAAVKDKVIECQAWLDASCIDMSLGKPQEALDALNIVEHISAEMGNKNQIGRILAQKGLAYTQLKEYAMALDMFTQYFNFTKEIKDRVEEGVALGNIARILQSMNRDSEAIELHQEQLKISMELNDKDTEARIYSVIGTCSASLGNHHDAIIWHEKHLRLAEMLQDKEGQVAACSNIAAAYEALGLPEKEFESNINLLVLARDSHMLEAELRALDRLAVYLEAQGQYARMVECLDKSLAVAREVGNTHQEVQLNGRLGKIYLEHEDLIHALQYFEAQLALVQQIGDTPQEVLVRGNIGKVLHERGQYAEALEMYLQKLELATKVGNTLNIAKAHSELGLLYQMQGQHQRAQDFHRKHLAIARNIGNSDEEAIALANVQRCTTDQRKSAGEI